MYVNIYLADVTGPGSLLLHGGCDQVDGQRRCAGLKIDNDLEVETLVVLGGGLLLRAATAAATTSSLAAVAHTARLT